MPNVHKRRPLSVRLPEADEAWLRQHATVRHQGRPLRARVWRRETLGGSFQAQGPALVLESGAALCMPPGWRLKWTAPPCGTASMIDCRASISRACRSPFLAYRRAAPRNSRLRKHTLANSMHSSGPFGLALPAIAVIVGW